MKRTNTNLKVMSLKIFL